MMMAPAMVALEIRYFDAVEHVVIALAPIGALHLQRIGPRLRLGEAECQYALAGDRGRQVAALLLLGAPLHDRGLADRAVPGEQGAHAGAFAADARDRRRVGGGVGAAPAVLFRHRHGEDVVLAAQRDHGLVVAVLQVAQILDRPHFPAVRVDVRQQRRPFRLRHRSVVRCFQHRIHALAIAPSRSRPVNCGAARPSSSISTSCVCCPSSGAPCGSPRSPGISTTGPTER